MGLFLQNVDAEAMSLRKFHGKKYFRITVVGVRKIISCNLVSLTLLHQNAINHSSLTPHESYKWK